MVTEETLKTHEMELESRIRNLVWTVSGDYTLKLRPGCGAVCEGAGYGAVRYNPPGRLFVLL